MIRQTSIEAFKSLKDTPELGNRQRQVYMVIAENPEISDLEISNISGLPINTVTPRRNELMVEGIVIDKGTKKSPITGRTVHAWSILDG